MTNFEQFSNDFYKYLVKNNYIEEYGLEILKNLKIAISGSYLLYKINKLAHINPLNGISSFQIAKFINELREKFSKFGIRLMIILGGIVRHDINNQQYFQDNMMIFRKTWETIYAKYYGYSSYTEKQEGNEPNKLEELLHKVTIKTLEEKHLIPILNEYKIEYLHAPYYTITQLKYITDYNYAHLAITGLESIIYSMNCILDIDLDKEIFKWLDVKKLNKNQNIDQPKAIQFFLVGGLDPSNDIYIPILDYLYDFDNGFGEENIKNREKILKKDSFDKEILEINQLDQNIAVSNQSSKSLQSPKENILNVISTNNSMIGQIPNDKITYGIKSNISSTSSSSQLETKPLFEQIWKELQGNMMRLLSENEKKLIHEKRKRLEINIIISSDCEIEFTPRENLDLLPKLYGPYFPSYIYMLYIYNIIDKELIENIANEKFLIKSPMADSAELHHHIDNYFKGTLEKMLGIILSKLHPNIKKINYSLIRFYFPDKNYILMPKEYKPARYLLKNEFIEKEKGKLQSKKNLVGFIQAAIIYTEHLKEINENNKKSEPSSSGLSSLTVQRKESIDFILNPKLGSSTAINKIAKNSETTDDNNTQVTSPSYSYPNISDITTSNQGQVNNNNNNNNYSQSQPQTHLEICFNVYLSFLELYDYLDTQNQRLMVIGAALRKCPENYEDAMIMLIELMKPGFTLLNGREFNNSRRRKVSSEMPLNTVDKREHLDNEFYQINLWNFNQTPEEKKRYIVLISRVFSLINPKIQTMTKKNQQSKLSLPTQETTNIINQDSSNDMENYSASFIENTDFDYDLCQYLVILQNLQTMLKYSFDSLMIYNFLAYYPKKDLKNLFELRKNLPFRQNLSIGLGMAVKRLMQTNANLKEFKACNPQYVDLEEDLKHGYQLWESVYTFIKYQESRGDHNAELSELFKGSNEILIKRLKELGII